MQRPTMRFVPIKNDAQLDLQALHRVRDRWVARRTAVMNQMRGFLLDRGRAIRKGPSYLAAQLQIIFANGDSSFSGRLLHLMLELKHEWEELDSRTDISGDKAANSPRMWTALMSAIPRMLTTRSNCF